MKFATQAAVVNLLLNSAQATKLHQQAKTAVEAMEDSCNCGLEEVGPMTSSYDGEVIENLYIVASPTDDTALKIKHENVTVRNVVIHHPANARGLYFWKANNMVVKNVDVVAYGIHATTHEDNWGAQPCPLRKPFQGYNCNNIFGYWAEGLVFKNVRVEGGSKGISIQQSTGAHFDHVVAKNIRGPFPAGQCFQIANYSDDAILENFYCLNELGKSWTEDTISAWRSSNVTIRNGVVDGGNSVTGMGVMFEGSSVDSIGGLVDNVEVRNAQGCFSGYPINGVLMKNSVCGPQYCDGTPERGQKAWTNNWTFGNNQAHGVYSQNNVVEDCFYTPICDNDSSRVYWTATAETEYPVATFTNLQELSLDDYVPKEPIELDFPWDGCFEVPDISCEDFPTQLINDYVTQTNDNTGVEKVVYSEGVCRQKEGNDCHPNEEDCVDGYVITSDE